MTEASQRGVFVTVTPLQLGGCGIAGCTRNRKHLIRHCVHIATDLLAQHTRHKRFAVRIRLRWEQIKFRGTPYTGRL